MGILSKVIKSVKDFSTTYPAVLAGYVMYSYLFITIMRFFLKAKTRELTLYEIYEVFDALPFLWLLTSALVNIIETRTKLHNPEKEKLLSLKELEIKQTQLNTMVEVSKGYQHRINNPLAIIFLSLGRMKRAAVNNNDLLEGLATIEDSANHIKQAVIDFTNAEKYEVQNVGRVVGVMASPSSGRKES